MAEERASIAPDTPLPLCPERSVGLSLPVPVNARIDQLVELVERAGERTSRKEIVALCVLCSPDNAADLVRRLRRYRQLTADSVYTSGPILVDALDLRPARPGPRRRKWRQQTPPK
jgi:hypothetical protein